VESAILSGRQLRAEDVITTRKSAEAEVRVVARFTNSHPMDGALIYRIEYGGRRLVYSTDVEWKEQCDPGFLSLVEEADLLIHDAQYTNHDYHQSKQGYGHSTLEMATDVARAAHVRQLILFHHEPTYDDSELDAMEAEARMQFTNTRSAYEGMEIDVSIP
jgi:ribonuclease BN (tRNA processing enzyme)